MDITAKQDIRLLSLQAVRQAVRTLQQWREAGTHCRLSINLSARHLDNRASVEEFIAQLGEYGSSLTGASVVAEGVQDSESARILIDLGCDDLQGYGISRPLFMEDFLKLLGGARLKAGFQLKVISKM